MAKRGKKNKYKGKPQPSATVGSSVVPSAADVLFETQSAAEAEAEVEVEVEVEAVRAPEPEANAASESPRADALTAPDSIEPAKAASLPQLRPGDKRAPFLVLADYEQRSLAHVAGLPEQLDAPGMWRGVAYRIGAHRLASGFDEVAEILSMPALTPVPGAQAWMLGVANVRGTLLPVVDLKQFLEGERTVLHEGQRVLVVRQPGGDVAVAIDEMYGQRSFIDAQGIDAAPVADGRYAHFIDRAYRINDQDWGVFSLERLARTPEFRQAAA